MKSILIFCMLFGCLHAGAQVYMTKSGNINFFSKTALENINANNSQVFVAIDAGKKNIAFAMLLKSFLFEKELMQEHFNENYVESDKYPKASFSGSYMGDVDLTKDGDYKIIVKGMLALHNVTKSIEQQALLEVKGNHIVAKATFFIKPEDYNISVPSLVREKIAANITVDINADCTLLK